MIKYMLVGHFNKYSHVALKWLKEKTAKKNPKTTKAFPQFFRTQWEDLTNTSWA